MGKWLIKNKPIKIKRTNVYIDIHALVYLVIFVGWGIGHSMSQNQHNEVKISQKTDSVKSIIRHSVNIEGYTVFTVLE